METGSGEIFSFAVVHRWFRIKETISIFADVFMVLGGVFSLTLTLALVTVIMYGTSSHDFVVLGDMVQWSMAFSFLGFFIRTIVLDNLAIYNSEFG